MNSEGFLTRNISGFTRTLEAVMVTEDLSRAPGLLQRLDPRVKVVTFLLFIVMVGLARSLSILAIIFVLILALTYLSRVPLGFFLKRVVIFIPIFTAVIALPALFITPGQPLVALGRVVITEQGARAAALLVLRVMDSLSFGVLLVLSTQWTSLLVALRWLGVEMRRIWLPLALSNAVFAIIYYAVISVGLDQMANL